jgi:PAS domain S-box-containing protein
LNTQKIRDAADRDRIETLFRQTPAAAIANAGCATVVVFALLPSARVFLMGWYSACLVVLACRWLLAAGYSRQPQRLSTRSWATLFTVGSLASGMLWGALGPFTFAEISFAQQTLIVLVVAGMVAGSSGVVASHLPAFWAFGISGIAPLSIAFAWTGNYAAAVLGFVFLGAMFVVARNVNRALVEAFTLRRDRELVVGELAQAKASLEDSNRALEERVHERTAELEEHARREQRIAEQLRLSEAKFRTLIEEMPDGIISCDDSTTVLSANPAAERILNRTAEQIVGRTLSDLGLTPARDGTASDDFGRLRPGGSFLTASRLRRSDGADVYVETHTRRVASGSSGATLEITIRDVTDREKAALQRRELEQHLRQAQRVESIGRLAGGIAHDFNNLMTVVLANATALSLDERIPAEQREQLAEIQTAAQRAGSLTQQLLAFSRRQHLEPKVVDLRDVARSVVRLSERLISEQVELDIELADSPAIVRADPTQLEQVLLNLISNAGEAMPDGGHLTVRVAVEPAAALSVASDSTSRPVSARADVVHLSVADTGVGMTPDICKQAFEPFFTRGKENGTGLGLSTVHGIVKQSGGEVCLDSRVGAGTTVHVYLPLCDEQPVSADSVPQSADSSVLAGGETILVVEDEQLVRRSTVRTLQRVGYHVLEAGNGTEALEIVRGRGMPIDMLVTDVVMPGMSGPELAAELARDRADLRVLFLSGYAGEAAKLPSDKAFLRKPYNVDQFLRTVRDQLTGA